MSKIVHKEDTMKDRKKMSFRVDPKSIYVEKNGWHFNKKLCDFAVSKMEMLAPDGSKTKIVPYTKDQVEELLRLNRVSVNNLKGFDHVFVANMCKADYLHSSIQNEAQLALYIKDVLDDPDGYDGISFVRWCADMEHTGVYIDWESFA